MPMGPVDGRSPSVTGCATWSSAELRFSRNNSAEALKDHIMRFSKSRVLAVVSGAVLSMAATFAAFADDTEIFFNQNGSDIPANVMFIMDSSGSMNDLVTTQFPYDSSQTYKADKCGANFDSNFYYYSNKGLPKCGTANQMDKKLFTCKSMLAPLKDAGFATDTFAQWGPTATSKTTGK